LAKVNRIPIEEIGANLRQVTNRLNTLVSSPQLEESLSHLTRTLNEVDQMLTQMQPQIGPLLTKLNEAAGQLSGTAQAAHELLNGEDSGDGGSLLETIHQLDGAARSVRTLADYLDRHPSALIRGKGPEKP
jgi:ABC-type transporter Mla subunit MlaD